MGPETGVLDLESSAVTVLSTIKLKRRKVVASTRATVETWWPNGLYTRLNIEGLGLEPWPGIFSSWVRHFSRFKTLTVPLSRCINEY